MINKYMCNLFACRSFTGNNITIPRYLVEYVMGLTQDPKIRPSISLYFNLLKLHFLFRIVI